MARAALLLGIAFVTLVACPLSLLTAMQPVVNPKASPANNDPKDTAADKALIDTESEAKATSLVVTHLPQLKPILRQLRENEPNEYAKAVRDLARSAKKLELAQSRSDRAFEVELELLQAQTEVNLLTARLRVRDNPRDRKLLRTGVARLQSAQLTRAEYEVQLLRERLARTQKQLDSAQQRLQGKQTATDEQVEKTYSSLLRKAGREPEGERSRDSSSALEPLPSESE
jgi:hypothetical protein